MADEPVPAEVRATEAQEAIDRAAARTKARRQRAREEGRKAPDKALVKMVPPDLPKSEIPFEISTSDFSGGTRLLRLESDGSFVTSDQEVIRMLAINHGYTAQPASPGAKATVLKEE